MSKQVTSLKQEILLYPFGCHDLRIRWDSLVVNFPKPICFKVTLTTARKSTGVVYPVITSLIVHCFGWGLLLTKHHKPRCLSLCHLNDYQHHNLSLSIFPLLFILGPINREMRHLISSLQNHNHQLKGDVQRYKRKLRETQMEINKVLLMLVYFDSFFFFHDNGVFIWEPFLVFFTC